MRILCVGGEQRRRYLARALEESNHSVVELESLDDAVWLAGTEYLDVVIVLANADAQQAARALAVRPANTVLVIIDMQGSAQTRVEALEAGADICLDGPYEYAELLARLQAITRLGNDVSKANSHGAMPPQSVLSASKRSLLCSDGSALLLRRREYLLMDRLLRTPGEAVPHAELVDYVFGDVEVDSTSLHRLVCRLRDRFLKAKATVRVIGIARVGYRAELDSPC